MKKRNIAAAILLASMMAVSTCAVTSMTAVAANFTVTISNATNDTASHTYSAYKVFSGDLHNGTLSNIQWGTGVDGSALLTALKGTEGNTAYGSGANPFSACADAAAVAKVIDAWTDDAENLQKFADIVSTHLATSANYTSATGSFTIPDTDAGYYFFKDTFTAADGQVGSNTKFILEVVGDVTAAAKTAVPTLDKKIVEGANKYSTSEASIGEVVNFEMTSAVPDMSKYTDYFFIFNDTMDDGLTFNASSVAVTVGSAMLTPGTDYEVLTTTDASPYTFQVVMKNFYEKFYQNSTPGDTTDDGGHTGEAIKVTYSATLNQNAVYYTEANENKASLTFANNPNYDYKGNNVPDKPGTTVPQGITPESKTETYTTAIKLKKVDGDGKALTGAEFTLTGDSVKTVIVYTDSFEENASGTWYKLANGTYTEADPDGSNNADYVSTTTKYTKTTTSTPMTKSESVSVKSTVDAEGYIIFRGLGSGIYTIEETVVPGGYNKAPNTVIEITDNHTAATLKNGTTPFVFTANKTAPESAALTLESGEKVYPITVINRSGVTLPSTGGIGTTIFYVVGGTLVAGAVVLLITKKRMSTPDQK